MSKTRILLHIVFATKRRKKSITIMHKKMLYSYINGILKERKCPALLINGVSDHIHMAINLSPTISLSELIKSIKHGSTFWIKNHKTDFPEFDGWAEGYFAISVSPRNIDSCIRYIANQEEHHKIKESMEEIEFMVKTSGLTWYKDDWE